MTQVTLTVRCPEADRDDATHLAVALGWIEGWRPEEWQGSFSSQFQDAQGNVYRVMSCPVGVSFVAAATVMGPVQRPPEDVEPYIVSLTGAHRAQDKMMIWQPATPDPETGETPDSPVPQVGSDKIAAIVGPTGREALALMGLTAVEE